MKNITLSMDENLLKAGRQYAKAHHTTFNSLIRSLVERVVINQSQQWLSECFSMMDQAKGSSRGKRWKREDLYRV